MDWTVLAVVALVGAYAGYLIGVLVRGTYVDRGGGGEQAQPREPVPEGPSHRLDHFGLWELEIARGVTVRA